jgi:chitodextrinase
MKNKTQILSIFMLYLVLALPLSSFSINAATAAPQIKNAGIFGITATTATAIWQTDEAANAKVFYGTTNSYGSDKELPGYDTFHYITLTGLSDGELYYYKIESCDSESSCNHEEGTFVAGSDVMPPFIEVSVPEKYNDDTFHLLGKTEPYSEIKIYVNTIYKGLISKTTTGAQGTIDFNVGGLKTGENTLRIVAQDSSGNLEEKEFSIFVDTNPPDYTINPIPDKSNDGKIIVSGSVNEPVTIKIYVTENYDETAPAKVLGIKAETIDKNSISIIWDENTEDDIDYYAIYRNNVLITTFGDNQFTDVNLNTDTNYNYQVSAVDKSCNIGEKSDQLALRTQSGGTIKSVPSEAIKLPCETKEPDETVSAATDFSQEVNLENGINRIKIVIADEAGNSIVVEKQVMYDSEEPKIEYTNLADITPTYIPEVTITGKVSEPATVFVFINKEEVPDIDRNTPVEQVVKLCTDKSSYKVSTDENGEFSIQVKLSREAYLAAGGGTVKGELANSWKNKITIVAVDRVGLTDTFGPRDVEYTLCGQGGDWNMVLAPLDRDVLIPRLILQGVEQFGLYYTMEWQGRSDITGAQITGMHLDVRDLSAEENAKFDEEWFGSATTTNSFDYTAAYSLITVQAPEPDGKTTLEKENNISNNRFGKCTLKGYGCVKLPLRLEILYSYQDPKDKKMVSKAQKQCWDIEMPIDRRAPSDKIPKEFLANSIKMINETLKIIDTVRTPLQTAKTWAFYGCAGLWGAYIVNKGLEYGSCFGVGANCLPTEEGEKGEQCRACLKQQSTTENVWGYLKWVCDRVMCPSAPSIQKYISDNSANTKTLSHCDVQDPTKINYKLDQDTINKCTTWQEDAYRGIVRDVKDTNWGAPTEECCEAEYMKEWDSAGALFFNELEESYCATLTNYSQQQATTGDQSNIPDKNCGGIKQLTRIARGLCIDQTNEPELIKINDKTYVIMVDDKTGLKTAYLAENVARAEGSVDWKEGDYISISGEVRNYIRKKDELFNEKQCYANGIIKPGINPMSYDDAKSKFPTVPKDVWELICIPREDYIIDPTSDIFSAFQSVCLSAIVGYLDQWREILSITKSCFETILYTGDGSAGVCKQFLSVYLCDLLYTGIRCLMQKTTTQGVGSEPQRGILGFFKYLTESGTKVQQRVEGRYGTSNIYQALFNERKLIHSLCLFAFTGDWDLDVEGLLAETENEVPIKPTCVISGNRRFITRDPEEYGMATFMYNLGAFVIAGSDQTSYSVELICSADNNCDKSQDFVEGRCDCLLYKDKQQTFNVRSGALSKGESFNEEIFESIQKPFRYDRARIKVTYRDNQGKMVEEVCGDINLAEAGGKPLAGCRFDLASFEYRCSFQWGQHGTAYFKESPKPNQLDFYTNQKFNLIGEIIKQSVSSDASKKETMFYKIRFMSGNSEILPEVVALKDDKAYDLAKDTQDFKPYTFVSVGETSKELRKINPFKTDKESEIASVTWIVSLHYATDEKGTDPQSQPIMNPQYGKQEYSGSVIVNKKAKYRICEGYGVPLTGDPCSCGSMVCNENKKGQYCCNKFNPYCKYDTACDLTKPDIGNDTSDIYINENKKSDKIVTIQLSKTENILFKATNIGDQNPGIYNISLRVGNLIGYSVIYDPPKKEVNGYTATVTAKDLSSGLEYPISIIAIDRDGNIHEVDAGILLKIK